MYQSYDAICSKNDRKIKLLKDNLQGKFNKDLDFLSQDSIYAQFCTGKIPRNVPAERYIPEVVTYCCTAVALLSDVSGNCLYSSFSLHLVGNNSLVGKLRLLTSIELYLNADFYSNHPLFCNITGKYKKYFPSGKILPFCVSFESLDSNETNTSLVQREALENCKDKRWCPFLCVLALSSVMNRTVSSLYPDNGDEKFSKLFNQTVFPRSGHPTHAEKIRILFCYEGTSLSHQPNHYVPILFCVINLMLILKVVFRKERQVHVVIMLPQL